MDFRSRLQVRDDGTDDRQAVQVLRRLPLNLVSRVWGRCQRAPLPRAARAPAYRLYSHMYSCNLHEANCQSLSDFRSLGEFFRRDLRPGARPIAQDSRLVSPADGRILHFGRVEDGRLEQVKGVTYSLQSFLGPRPLEAASPAGGVGDLGSAGRCMRRSASSPDTGRIHDSAYHRRLLLGAASGCDGLQLMHCVIYLAPGDYHKFHSPTDWLLRRRRHFPGRLLSVSPLLAARVRGLFCENERAAYLGSWAHGFFCFVAVGATNVGSIRVYCDEELKTNRRQTKQEKFSDKDFEPELEVVKGELFGEFNLGSTIVLVFEAPADFRFELESGQKIRVGEPLGKTADS